MFRYYPILFLRKLKRYKKYYFISFFIFTLTFTAFLSNRLIRDGYYSNHTLKVYRVFSNPQTSSLLLRNFDDDLIMSDDYVGLLKGFSGIKGVVEYRVVEDLIVSCSEDDNLLRSNVHFANDVIFDVYKPYFKYSFNGVEDDEVIICDSLAMELGVDMGDLVVIGGSEYRIVNVFEKQNNYALFDYDLLVGIGSLVEQEGYGKDIKRGRHIFVMIDSEEDYQLVNRGVNLSGSFDKFLYFMDIRINNFYGMNTKLKTDNSNFIDILMNMTYLLFILSSISYIILNMSFSSNKLKEIGLRKLFGASKMEIFFINVVETVIISLISSFLGILVIYYLIDGSVLEKFGFGFWIGYLFLGVGIGVSAGFYSAYILAKKEIDDLLRRLMRVGVRGYFHRKMLLIVQYSLAVFISIYCINSYKQYELLVEHKYTNNRSNWVEIGVDSRNELDEVLVERVREIVEGNDNLLGYVVDGGVIKIEVKNLGLVKSLDGIRSELLEGNGYGFEYVSLMNDGVEGAISFDLFIKNQLFYMMVFVIAISLIITYVFSEYMTKERKKEISIRKILGASTTSIYLLFQKEMVVITLNSILIAWAVSFFPLRTWINQFLYQYEMSVFDYLYFSIITLVLVVVTVTLPIVSYARTDPADVLRD